MARSRVSRLAALSAVVVLALSATSAAARGPRPANDDQAASTPIAVLPFTESVDVSRITRNAGDPTLNCFNGGTVWYSFASTDSRMLTVSTIGSEVPAGAEVYRQTATGLQPITCAYDFQTFASMFQVEPATTYLIMVGPASASSTRGTITISVDTYGTPPAHDSKAGAIDVAPGATLESDSTGSTKDSDDFGQCYTPGATVWHRFVAPADGRYSASVTANGFEPVLNVGEQTPAGIVPGGCVSGSSAPTFIEVMSGRTYYLLVGSGTGLQGGPYSLTVAAAPPVVPTVTIAASGSTVRENGGAVISGTVVCSEAASFRLVVIVAQGTVQGSAFPVDPIACGLSPIGWSATVVPSSGAFKPGPTDVIAGGTAYTQSDYGSAETSASVTLRGR